MERIKAYAKINLTLDVLNKRPDGYHELRGIMHTVDIHDTVTVEKSDAVEVESTLFLTENSAAGRAAEAYRSLSGCGARIHIEHHIPSEAGLGSASADAAGVLMGMDRLYHAVNREKLYDIAASVGADVPFCLMQGCALAEGIGEQLTPLPRMELELLIVKGERGVSTKELFSSLSLPVEHPDNEAALNAVRLADRRALTKLAFNSLEAPASAIRPEIMEYRARLLEHGAQSAFMTGSGAAVVGIFPSRKAAEAALPYFEDCAFRRVCRTV